MDDQDLLITMLEKKQKMGTATNHDILTLCDIYLEKGSFVKLQKLLDYLDAQYLNDYEKSLTLYTKGQIATLSGNFEESTIFFEDAINILENNNDISDDKLYLLGLSCHAMSMSEFNNTKASHYINKLKEYMEKLISINPNYDVFSTSYHLAWAYASSGDFNKAISFFKKAIKASKSKHQIAIAMEGIGTIYLEVGKINRSLKYLQKASENCDNDWFYYKTLASLGRAYYAAENISEAEKKVYTVYFNMANYPILKNNIEFQIEILMYLGVMAYNKENYEKSSFYLEKLISIIDEHEPKIIMYYLTLAKSLCEIGEYEKAIVYYKTIIGSPLANEEDKQIAFDSLNVIREPTNIQGDRYEH